MQYKLQIRSPFGWREEYFSDDIELLKNRIEEEIKINPQNENIVLYQKSTGYDNWSILFAGYFHEISYFRKLTGRKITTSTDIDGEIL